MQPYFLGDGTKQWVVWALCKKEDWLFLHSFELLMTSKFLDLHLIWAKIEMWMTIRSVKYFVNLQIEATLEHLITVCQNYIDKSNQNNVKFLQNKA